jgi:peptidoglycan/LPS O-acetylase OafA/YrhL
VRISSAEPAVAPNLAPPPGNPRFPLVDSLRAIAALLVFAGHTVTETTSLAVHPERFVWATNVAYEGVALFFLISGFLLYRPFVAARAGGRAVPLPDYARRRVLRIVPAYWAALSIFLALGLVSRAHSRERTV